MDILLFHNRFQVQVFHFLPRSSCTTVYATWQRKHVLLPAQTYFLSNEVQNIGQYNMSGNLGKSDWVKNLLKKPNVTLRIAGQAFPAIASVDATSAESLIRNKMADKYKEREADGSLSEWAQTALVVKFSPHDS